MENITGVRRGTFDQFFVRDANQNIVNVLDLAGGGIDISALQAKDLVHDTQIAQLGTDVLAVDTRVDGAVATNTVQGVAIAGKQDQLSAPAGAGQVSLLNGASVLKALQAGTGVSLTNAGSHVVVNATGGGVSGLTAAAPITLTGSEIGLTDLTGEVIRPGQCFVSYDLSCHDFAVNGLISGPGRVLLDSDTQASINAAVAVVSAENSAQDVTIATKQNQLINLALGIQVSLLNGDALKPLQAGTGVTLTDQTSHVVVSAAVLSAAAPITITNGVVGMTDLAGEIIRPGQCFVSHDLSCHDFAVNGLISGPGRVQLNSDTQALVDASSEPLFAVSSDLEKTAGSPPTLGLTASYKTSVQGDILAAVTAGVANKEPVFQTTSDLTKTFNLGASPPTIELGISATLEARIAALEAVSNPFFCAGTIAPNGSVVGSEGRVGLTVTRQGTGVYDVAFASAYPSGADFTFVVSCDQNVAMTRGLGSASQTLTAGGLRVYTRGHVNNGIDATTFFIVI